MVCILNLFVIFSLYNEINLINNHFRSYLVPRRRWLRSPRDADHAPHECLPSVLCAGRRHSVRSIRLRTGSRRIWRHCHYIWRLGLRSWLRRFYDVNINSSDWWYFPLLSDAKIKNMTIFLFTYTHTFNTILYC